MQHCASDRCWNRLTWCIRRTRAHLAAFRMCQLAQHNFILHFIIYFFRFWLRAEAARSVGYSNGYQLYPDDSRRRTGIFPFTTRPALESTQPVSTCTGSFLPGATRLGREDDHPPPYHTKVTSARSNTSIQPYVYMTCQLTKHKANCPF